MTRTIIGFVPRCDGPFLAAGSAERQGADFLTPAPFSAFERLCSDIADRALISWPCAIPGTLASRCERATAPLRLKGRQRLKPAIFTSFDHALSFAQVLPLIRQAGFEAVSFGAWPQGPDCTTARGRSEIQKLLADNSLTIDSIHAPFPQGDRLFSVDESERLESVDQCRLTLDAAVELDGRIVVIHLIQPYGIPTGEVRSKMLEQGRRSVGVLAAHAGARGVKLALENGQEPEYDQVLESLLAEFDAPHVGLCCDSGHENVQGTCFRLLEELGHRLLTVHIHDNKGSDTHQLPYEGTINWERFCQVIHGLGYFGNLLLEVNMDHSRFTDHSAFLAQAMMCAERFLPCSTGDDT